MGNMREISLDECNAVFGGRDIVVIGSPPPPSSNGEIVVTGNKPLFGNMYANYTNNPYYQSAMAGNYGAPMGANSSGSTPVNGPGMVDTDGDGIPDSPEIVVTAAGTAAEARLADAIASQQVKQFLGSVGLGLGLIGAELSVLIRAAGFSEKIAGGVVGALGATGLPTSGPDLVNKLEAKLYELVFDERLKDIHNNPKKYGNWMLNPFTRDYFDGNARQYNQFD